MGDERRQGGGVANAGALSGTIWFVGWLFTIGFVGLPFWRALLALVIWPYFLGAALR